MHGRSILGMALGIMLHLAIAATGQAGFVFNLTSTGDAQADAAFALAASKWTSIFSDDITLNISCSYASLGAGVLGSASSTSSRYTYTEVRAALVSDATSATDATATANLQAAPAFDLYINRTTDNPNGSGSATPYLDNDDGLNNSDIRMNYANAKALGLRPGNDAAIDCTITMNSDMTWDFNPDDGIDPGKYSFVGTATHEFGHSMGFTSGVDVLDTNSNPTPPPGNFAENSFRWVSVLDLYRYSADSYALNALDWAADTRTKYFSIDGGVTPILDLSTGKNFGDGYQASHWIEDNFVPKLQVLMDPNSAAGELKYITPYEILAFDAIGYDLIPIPEPTALALLAVGGTAMLCRRRRRPLDSN